VNDERDRWALRTLADIALAIAAAAAFAILWTVPQIDNGVRRVTGLGLSLLLVVLWHEAARSRSVARTAGRNR
jgi:hypothetical protein